MKIPWTLGGALLGRALLGKWGMVAGGALACWLAPDGKRDRLSSAAVRKRPSERVSATSEEGIEAQERYPEETIIDAMLEGEDTEERIRQQEEVAG